MGAYTDDICHTYRADVSRATKVKLKLYYAAKLKRMFVNHLKKVHIKNTAQQ